MTTRDLLWLVVSNLRRMKARVAMTAIGVVIGTAAVVVLVSLGVGLQKQASTSLFGMGGLDELTVRDQSYWGGDDDRQRRRGDVLNDAMLERIRQMEDVAAVTPLLEVQGTMLKLNRQEGWGQIYGVDVEAFTQIVEIAQGELQMGRGQVVVGARMAEAFIPWEEQMSDEQPPPPEILDETIQLVSYQYGEGGVATEETVGRLRVAGIIKAHGWTFDYAIFMPLEEAKRLNKKLNAGVSQASGNNRAQYPQVMVKATDSRKIPALSKTFKDMGFNVESSQSMLKEINKFFLVVQAVLGGIGAIALLVAAFGIANTMIMAIYERTREIGLMKAIGATNQDVMSVFLAEAGSIGFLGGVGGVLLATGFNALINVVGKQMLSQSGGLFGEGGTDAATTLTHTPLWLIIFAIVFAVLIGVISGIYPAIRAAALSPIRALKYE